MAFDGMSPAPDSMAFDSTGPCTNCSLLHHNGIYYACLDRRRMRCCGHSREQFAQENGITFTVRLRTKENFWPHRFDPGMVLTCTARESEEHANKD